jgi:hypothetical protein
LEEKVVSPVEKSEITTVGIRRADYATHLYPQKLALTLPTSFDRSVGIFISRTQATEFVLFVCGKEIRWDVVEWVHLTRDWNQ